MSSQAGTVYSAHYPAPLHPVADGTTGHPVSWILFGFALRHHDTALSSMQARCGALDNAQVVPLAHACRSNRSHVCDKDDGLFDLPCDLPNSAVIN